jgi:hypothetical protein
VSDLVKATWVPAWECLLPDGRALKQGGTALIPRHEAQASDNWTVVAREKPAPKTDAKDAD